MKRKVIFLMICCLIFCFLTKVEANICSEDASNTSTHYSGSVGCSTDLAQGTSPASDFSPFAGVFHPKSDPTYFNNNSFDGKTTGTMDLTALKELKAKRVRMTVPWNYIEPIQGEFNNSLILEMDEDLRDAQVVSAVLTLKCNAQWATRSGSSETKSMPPLLQYIPHYKHFVRKVASLLKNSPIDYSFQIENEPYTIPGNYWGGTIEEYAYLFKIAERAIEEGDPLAQVGIGGIPHDTLQKAIEGDYPSKARLAYVLSKTKDINDFIDVHLYLSENHMYTALVFLSTLIQEYGHPGVPVISTERGSPDMRLCPWAPPYDDLLLIPDVQEEYNKILNNASLNIQEKAIVFAVFLRDHPVARGILERYQAGNLVIRIVQMIHLGLKETHSLCMQDSPFRPPHKIPKGYYDAYECLCRSHGIPKPMFWSYKMVIELLEGYKSVTQILSNSEGRMFRFDFLDRDPLYVLWRHSWSQASDMTPIDLSGIIPSQQVRIKHIVTSLKEDHSPNYKKDGITFTNTIFVPGPGIPMFIEPVSIEMRGMASESEGSEPIQPEIGDEDFYGSEGDHSWNFPPDDDNSGITWSGKTGGLMQGPNDPYKGRNQLNYRPR